MTTLLFISILLAVSFVGIAAVKLRSIPVSISSLVDVFRGDCRWLWTVWVWAVVFTLAAPLMDVLSPNWQSVGFFTLFCLVMCGAMPLFLVEKQKWHSAFGIAAGILSQVCVAFICSWCLLAWLAFVYMVVDVLLIARNERWYEGKVTFVAEAICAVSTYTAVFIGLNTIYQH